MSLEPRTHLRTDKRLCGEVESLAPGAAVVALTVVEEMAVDERGLAHGGFVFGLADYAAMLAVNDPNVVLGAAEVRFLKPVTVWERVVARAQVNGEDRSKRAVEVEVRRGDDLVFKGTFDCFVLDRHILDRHAPDS